MCEISGTAHEAIITPSAIAVKLPFQLRLHLVRRPLKVVLAQGSERILDSKLG